MVKSKDGGMAGRIERDYEKKGVSSKVAKKIAWSIVNKKARKK